MQYIPFHMKYHHCWRVKEVKTTAVPTKSYSPRSGPTSASSWTPAWDASWRSKISSSRILEISDSSPFLKQCFFGIPPRRSLLHGAGIWASTQTSVGCCIASALRRTTWRSRFRGVPSTGAEFGCLIGGCCVALLNKQAAKAEFLRNREKRVSWVNKRNVWGGGLEVCAEAMQNNHKYTSHGGKPKLVVLCVFSLRPKLDCFLANVTVHPPPTTLASTSSFCSPRDLFPPIHGCT